MKLIAHRGLWKDRSQENRLRSFQDAFDLNFGIETDLRSFKGKLFLSHDPILDSSKHDSFESLLELATHYPRLPVFLNIKEDGLLPLINQHRGALEKINVIFFDMSVPELIQYAKSYPPNHLATRVSEFETSPAAIELCDWVWVDGFTREIKPAVLESMVKSHTKNWAFVSPELHGRAAEGFWNTLAQANYLPQNQVFLCTDLPHEYLRRAA